MLDDRSYMRDPMYGQQRSYTIILLATLGICFVLQSIIQYYVRGFPFYQVFGLTEASLLKGWIWQFLSFQFLHGGFVHILLNCWGIYVFGRPVEESLGPARFLQVYFGSGVAGGLLQCLGMMVLPSHFGNVPVVGASAGLFGLIATYAALFPSRQLTLLLFFILPVTLTARMLLIFSGLLAIFGILVPSGGVAHGAHFGGLLAGLAYVRWIVHSDFQLPKIRFLKREKVFVRGPRSAVRRPRGMPEQEMELPSEEFISKEVDPILDKISAHGIQSLTERERKILEAARAKMAKR